MSDPFAAQDTFDGPPPRRAPRGHPWLAWGFIALLAALFIFRQATRDDVPQEEEHHASELSRIVTELQLRYLLGAADALPLNAQELYEQAKTMNQGPVPQRLRFVTVAGELGGPQEALDTLNNLDAAIQERGLTLTPEEERTRDILRELYTDYAQGDAEAAAVSAEERQILVDQLDWFGELALHPRSVGVADPVVERAGAAAGAAVAAGAADRPERAEVLAPAQRTFVTLLGAVVGMLLLAAVGFLALVVFLVLLMGRRLQGGLVTGETPGGVYAETFAVWIALFLGLLAGLGTLEELSMIQAAGVAMLLSLLALGWPVLRGIPWSQVRQDIGWTWGRQPALEPAAGVLCYLMALPLLFIGLAFTIVLIVVQRALTATTEGDPFAPTPGPAHPVVEFLAGDDMGLRLQVVLLAAVVAPIVEETMFRGVLYRHLREATGRWSFLGSVFFSGTVASFIFAIVHPQGIVAVPLLMALAYGFTIAREWRGTLIPAIVGHGLNNGLVSILAINALSG